MFLGVLGCASQSDKTEKLRDLEFTVLDKDEIPESFMEEISKRVEKGFKLTFEDQGYLYIAEGYGKQETSGYSIEVKKLYETELLEKVLKKLCDGALVSEKEYFCKRRAIDEKTYAKGFCALCITNFLILLTQLNNFRTY